MAAGATRAALTQHFAQSGNAADISAKEGSQASRCDLCLDKFAPSCLYHLNAVGHKNVYTPSEFAVDLRGDGQTPFFRESVAVSFNVISRLETSLLVNRSSLCRRLL